MNISVLKKYSEEIQEGLKKDRAAEQAWGVSFSSCFPKCQGNVIISIRKSEVWALQSEKGPRVGVLETHLRRMLGQHLTGCPGEPWESTWSDGTGAWG